MKDFNKIKKNLAQRRVLRVRAKISGNAAKPRLAVFKGLRHLSMQAIDDSSGRTLASAYDREIKGENPKERARAIGELIAKKLGEQKITTAVFDKRHYQYHGLVKAMADGARAGGLKF